MPKKSLDLLLAVGKPKAPDDMPPEIMEEEMVEEPSEKFHMEPSEENCITLPPGFKAPDGSEDGKVFSTTIRGKILDGKFYPEAIGDMPLDGKATVPSDEAPVEPMDDGYAAQKAESDAARSVFQPGR